MWYREAASQTRVIQMFTIGTSSWALGRLADSAKRRWWEGFQPAPATVLRVYAAKLENEQHTLHTVSGACFVFRGSTPTDSPCGYKAGGMDGCWNNVTRVTMETWRQWINCMNVENEWTATSAAAFCLISCQNSGVKSEPRDFHLREQLRSKNTLDCIWNLRSVGGWKMRRNQRC